LTTGRASSVALSTRHGLTCAFSTNSIWPSSHDQTHQDEIRVTRRRTFFRHCLKNLKPPRFVRRRRPRPPTPSGIFQSSSEESARPSFSLRDLARAFPLPGSHYVLL